MCIRDRLYISLHRGLFVLSAQIGPVQFSYGLFCLKVIYMTDLEFKYLENDGFISNDVFENEIFESVNFEKADFREIEFKNCRFLNCNFMGASFVDSTIKNCDFSNCDISDSYFKNTKLYFCRAEGCLLYTSGKRL